jgi:transposase InsO family protein
LEDHANLPAELQQRVVAEVDQAKERSSMKVDESLRHLGVSRASYYRWKKDEAWQREHREPIKPVQAFEALEEEKSAVVDYAKQHPEIRHRELSWRMIDADVEYLSASTVYRILLAEELMHRHRGRRKRYREDLEKASSPDEIWGTDLVYIKVDEVQYYLVIFLDEYSRFVVHWELLTNMEGATISVAAERALETLGKDAEGQLKKKPIIRSDNGSGYISGDFVGLLSHHGLTHHRIKPHCPEENGTTERFNRTLREGIEEHLIENRQDAERVVGQVISHYNNERLHGALDYQTPSTWYRGNPEHLRQERRKKMAMGRHRRKQVNLGIRQPTFPQTSPESVLYN